MVNVLHFFVTKMTKPINYEQERKQETREKDKTRTSYIYIYIKILDTRNMQ